MGVLGLKWGFFGSERLRDWDCLRAGIGGFLCPGGGGVEMLLFLCFPFLAPLLDSIPSCFLKQKGGSGEGKGEGEGMVQGLQGNEDTYAQECEYSVPRRSERYRKGRDIP